MKHEKLYNLLGALTNKQLKEYQYSLYSPFKSLRPQGQRLFIYLKRLKFHPTRPEKIINAIALDKPKQLDDLMNKLLTNLQAFCTNVVTEKSAHPVERDLSLLKFYSDKQLWKNYSFIKGRIEKELKIPALFPEEFLLRYRYSEVVGISEKFKKNRSDDGELVPLDYFLDAFYFYNKLKHQIEAYSRNVILGSSYAMEVSSETMLITSTAFFQAIPTIQLLYKINRLYIEDFMQLEERYTDLQQLYADILARKSDNKVELTTLIHLMMNICIEGINRKISFFYHEYLEHVCLLDKKDYLLEKGALQLEIFKNVVTAAVKLDRILWLKQFYNKYSPSLNLEYKLQILKYYEAFLAFHSYKILLAYKLLPNVDNYPADNYYQLALRRLRIKIQMELTAFKELEVLEYYLAEFRRYLARAEIGAANKHRHQEFLEMFQKLIHYKKAPNLNKNPSLLEHQWFVHMFQKRAII